MYPPVGIGQVRISNSHDITLADRLHIPAGTCIWVPHHAIQNASFNWDDPTKFMPGALRGLLHACSYVPTNPGAATVAVRAGLMALARLCRGCPAKRTGQQ